MGRVRVCFAASLAIAGLATLVGCGKSTSTSTTPAAAPAPTSAPPAELTDAQKKALLAELPPAYRDADLVNGEAKFAVCRSCHTINQGGEDMIGPNLWGIFGRKAGSEPGFAYSDDMKNAGWTWDADHIDKWIADPRAVLPGTKMTFAGLADPNDRRDIVAFLKTQTSPPPKG